ncbi:unnamed protein product [Caenorhabditis brenneri]
MILFRICREKHVEDLWKMFIGGGQFMTFHDSDQKTTNHVDAGNVGKLEAMGFLMEMKNGAAKDIDLVTFGKVELNRCGVEK